MEETVHKKVAKLVLANGFCQRSRQTRIMALDFVSIDGKLPPHLV